MRGFDCTAPDGAHPDTLHFEGETDDEIIKNTSGHLSKYHQALGMTDDQVREMVTSGSYEMVRRAPAAKM